MATPPGEDVWNSYKELRSTVWNYLNHKSKSELPATDLENILMRHKPNFATLLQNPVSLIALLKYVRAMDQI